MPRGRKVIKGAIFQVTTFLLNVIIVFLLMPFLVNTLGSAIYGLWVLVSSFSSYYMLLDLGISSAVSRYLAQAIGRDDRRRYQEIMSNSVSLYCLIALFVLLITVLIVVLLPGYSESEHIDTIRLLIVFIGVEFAISLPLRPYMAVLSSHLDFDILSIITIVMQITRSILIFFVLSHGYGILTLALINFCSNTSMYISVFIVCRYRFSWLRLKWDVIHKKTMLELFTFSKYVFLSKIAGLVRFRVDSLVIASFLGLVPVTVYAIASRISNQFIALMNQITGVMGPLFSQYEGQKDIQSIREKYLLSVRVALVISFFIGGCLIVFGKFFIIRWMGIEYVKSYYVLVVLTVGLIFTLNQSVGINVLMSVNKHKYFAWMNIVESFMNIIISIILVKKIGIVGVAFGTAVPMIIMSVFVRPIVVCKFISLNHAVFYKTMIIPFVIYSVYFTLLYLYIVNKNIIGLTYFEMSAYILLVFIPYAILSYFLVMKHDERRCLEKILIQIIGKNV